MLSAGQEDASRGREGRFGPTDQRQRTLQIYRLYLVIVVVTIGGKVDTAETGVGGDYELSTVSPKIVAPKLIHFPTLSFVGNLNKLTAPLPCTVWHPGKMHKLTKTPIESTEDKIVVI